MDNIQLVIFDMDGLLFNTEEVAYSAMREAMESYNFDFPRELYKKMIGMRQLETNQLLYIHYGDDLPLDQILLTYREAFKKRIETKGVGVKPGVHELLDFLDQQQIKRCIASSSSIKTIENYLILENLTNRFDFYISGEEVPNGKPEPDIFIEACHRAHTNIKNAIVLEDSYNGFLSAYKANIPCVVVPDMIEPNEQMKKHAFHIAPSLHDVITLLK